MAIKIIKEGNREFNATCVQCDCEFTYELEDVRAGKIVCPCCGYVMYHAEFIRAYRPSIGEPLFTGDSDPCKDCALKGHSFDSSFGDLCSFCPKNPFKVTC